MLSPCILYVHLRTQVIVRNFLFFYFMFKLKKIFYFMSVTNPGGAQVHVSQCAIPLDEIMDRTYSCALLKYKFNVTVVTYF